MRRVRRWVDSISLTTSAVAATAVFALLVAGTFVILLVTVSDLKQSTSVQRHSRDVTAATLRLQAVVNQLEAGLRAFLLSGNDRFLVSWRAARQELSPALSSIDRLIPVASLEHHEVNVLATSIGAYVSDYGVPLIRIFRISPQAARAPVASRAGVSRITAIRTQLDRMLARETQRATADAASSQREAKRALPVAIGALLAAIGLLVLYGLFLSRRIARPVRRVADGATAIAGGDLSTRLIERGPAEIRSLEGAFNVMAASIEQGQHDLERQNERLRQSERLKSQLISIVSHELRTPLSSILGYTRLLRTRQLAKPDQDRYLEIVEQQGDRLAALVDRFLDGESIDSGRIELDDETIDLRPVIAEEVRLVADKADRHRIEVVMGAGSLPVRGDRDRLAQVFGNLLENAVKYSPQGGTIEVVTEVASGVIRVGVRDEGIGVAEEHQSRLFTKFFRADARESGIAGTGLGLAISRDIVEAHGGRIGFESEAGKGSHFWFELPLAGVGRPAPVEQATHAV